MKHKIVFFDMDGTLYQTENDVIQESALDAIQTLKDKGYIVKIWVRNMYIKRVYAFYL